MGRLVFPLYRDKGLRVSEQEARFAFVESLLRQKSLRYSIEAPTSETYSFSGGGERSAQTDLKVHDTRGTVICNVEFKAKGVRPPKQGFSGETSKKISSIQKDVQKLLCEREWGLWFHLLESVNSSTIEGLLEVMAQQITEVQCKCKGIATQGLTVHVCVLKHGFSLQKDVPLHFDEDELANHLRFSLRVSKTELMQVNDLNGWDLQRRS